MRERLKVTEACHPPGGVFRLLETFRREHLENLLIDVAVWHREAFEEALLNEHCSAAYLAARSQQ